MNSRLSESDRLEILRLFVAGVGRRVIASRFKVTKDYPRMLAWRHGLNVGGDNKRRLSEDQEAEMLALYSRGLKVIPIADQFGVHFAYPSRLARRHGVPLRNPKLPEKPRRVAA
jgi:hypothetical protein